MSLSVHIRKKLGDFEAHVDFETASEPLGLLGASGCGKSVTLNCIAGIMKPDSGRIELNGKVLFDSEKHINLPPQKRNIGYMFQEYALFPNMTVLENIQAGVRSGTRSEKKAAALQAVERFHLGDVIKQYPKTLSGGQKQRTALARILVGNPELLLLDEPFSALDSYLKWQLLWEMAEYLQPYTGDVLFVSHDREELSKLCRSVCVLDNGRSEPVQSFKSFLSRPQTIASAKLAGYRNIAFGSVSGGLFSCPSWNITLPCNNPLATGVCLSDECLHAEKITSTDVGIECIVAGYSSEGEKNMLMLRPVNGADGSLLCMLSPESEICAGETIFAYFSQNNAVFLTNTAIVSECFS